MTRDGRRLVDDFLIPALENQKYGDLLKWIDRDKRKFALYWSHKNAAKWAQHDTKVFQDWDKLKGHYRPESDQYFMQSKQRFRAALYKLRTVAPVFSCNKKLKLYKFVEPEEKKEMEKNKRKKLEKAKYRVPRIPKKVENRKSIPTSVICKHSSHPEQQNSMDSEPSNHPSSSSEFEESILELERCRAEYNQAQQKHMKNVLAEQMNDRAIKEENSEMEVCNTSALKEADMNQRVPHIPIKPPPSYPYYEGSGPRYESPALILVQLYNSPSKEVKVKEEVKDDMPQVEYHVSPAKNAALNLCMMKQSAFR